MVVTHPMEDDIDSEFRRSESRSGSGRDSVSLTMLSDSIDSLGCSAGRSFWCCTWRRRNVLNHRRKGCEVLLALVGNISTSTCDSLPVLSDNRPSGRGTWMAS